MKKGFTLVELLAVVIILGILAVVIVPKIQQTIKDSKKNTYEASAHALDREADVFYTNHKINQSNFNGCEYNFTTGNNTCEGFEFKGEKPESGGLKISIDGKSAFGLKYDDYCYSKGYDDDEINIIETDNCVIPKQIGEEIIIDGEHFYVIDSNAQETELLAKYNLNIGYERNTDYPKKQVDFHVTYWIESNWVITTGEYENSILICPNVDDTANIKPKYGTQYPFYYYDESATPYTDLEEYKSTLTNVKEIKLPSYEDVYNLGCNTNSCNNNYPWLTSSPFILGTALSGEGYYSLNNKIDQSIVSIWCQAVVFFDENDPGIRPIIIVDTKDI